jgi:hypothetical protein
VSGKRTYSTADVAAALAAFVRRGSLKAAASETGVPWETIREWASHPKWAQRLSEIRRAHAREVRELWSAAARDAADGLMEAVLLCRQALRREGLAPRDVAAITRTLATVLSSVERLTDPEVAGETVAPLEVHFVVRDRDGVRRSETAPASVPQ